MWFILVIHIIGGGKSRNISINTLFISMYNTEAVQKGTSQEQWQSNNNKNLLSVLSCRAFSPKETFSDKHIIACQDVQHLKLFFLSIFENQFSAKSAAFRIGGAKKKKRKNPHLILPY